MKDKNLWQAFYSHTTRNINLKKKKSNSPLGDGSHSQSKLMIEISTFRLVLFTNVSVNEAATHCERNSPELYCNTLTCLNDVCHRLEIASHK